MLRQCRRCCGATASSTRRRTANSARTNFASGCGRQPNQATLSDSLRASSTWWTDSEGPAKSRQQDGSLELDVDEDCRRSVGLPCERGEYRQRMDDRHDACLSCCCSKSDVRRSCG